MKKTLTIYLFALFSFSLFSQNGTEINLPKNAFENETYRTMVHHELKDNSVSVSLSVETTTVPENVKSSKEFYKYHLSLGNQESVISDDSYSTTKSISIDGHEAFVKHDREDYSSEENIYLLLNNKGYVFSYLVWGYDTEAKNDIYSKYYQQFRKYVENVKINDN